MPDKFNELKKVCEPAVQYLNQNHDPHTYIVISMDSIKVIKEELGVPIDPFVPEDSINGKHDNNSVKINNPY